MNTMNPTDLATFITAPDAADFVAVINKLQEPVRASMLVHLMMVANLSAVAAVAAPEPVVAAAEPLMLGAPETAPKAKAKSKAKVPMLNGEPLLSTSLEGRVDERRLKGQTPSQIAKDEGIDTKRVNAILAEAKAARKAAESDDKTKGGLVNRRTLSMEERRAIKARIIELRAYGYGPKTISRRLSIPEQSVSTTVWEAKRDHNTVFPNVDEVEAAKREAASKSQPVAIHAHAQPVREHEAA
jgi:hypothetical protein